MVALTLSASCIFSGEPVSEIDLPVEGELMVVRDTDDNDRGELFFINADGSDVRRIMDDQGYGLPAWSPDGQQLAALASTSEGHPIVIIDVASVTSTPIEAPAGSYEDPAWSPDGQWIAFVTQFRNGESLGPTHLSIVNAHDSDAKAETIVRDLASSSSPEWRPSPD